jgi:hypothetical protein
MMTPAMAAAKSFTELWFHIFDLSLEAIWAFWAAIAVAFLVLVPLFPAGWGVVELEGILKTEIVIKLQKRLCTGICTIPKESEADLNCINLPESPTRRRHFL